MMSTIISITLVAVILGAAVYFLVKQTHEKPKTGSDNGSSGDIQSEDHNDTSGSGGYTSNN